MVANACDLILQYDNLNGLLVQTLISYIGNVFRGNYARLQQILSKLNGAYLTLPIILLIFVVLSFAYDRNRCSYN